jgi:uncharacterized protein (DUF983 family)
MRVVGTDRTAVTLPAMVRAEYVLEAPTRAVLLRRGLARRCPLCGAGSLFDRWVAMREVCPRCDLRFERVEGHWLGAIGLNTAASAATLLVVVAVGTVLTAPTIPLLPLLAAATLTALVTPVVFHPVSRTLWTAIDLAVRPIDPEELS